MSINHSMAWHDLRREQNSFVQAQNQAISRREELLIGMG